MKSGHGNIPNCAVVSYNVTFLNDIKLEAIKSFLTPLKNVVCALQETHHTNVLAEILSKKTFRPFSLVLGGGA